MLAPFSGELGGVGACEEVSDPFLACAIEARPPPAGAVCGPKSVQLHVASGPFIRSTADFTSGAPASSSSGSICSTSSASSEAMYSSTEICSAELSLFEPSTTARRLSSLIISMSSRSSGLCADFRNVTAQAPFAVVSASCAFALS